MCHIACICLKAGYILIKILEFLYRTKIQNVLLLSSYLEIISLLDYELFQRCLQLSKIGAKTCFENEKCEFDKCVNHQGNGMVAYAP